MLEAGCWSCSVSLALLVISPVPSFHHHRRIGERKSTYAVGDGRRALGHRDLRRRVEGRSGDSNGVRHDGCASRYGAGGYVGAVGGLFMSSVLVVKYFLFSSFSPRPRERGLEMSGEESLTQLVTVGAHLVTVYSDVAYRVDVVVPTGYELAGALLTGHVVT